MFPPKIFHKLNLARSGVYFLESIPFALVSRFITHPELPPPTNDQVATMWSHILKLHERDAAMMKKGAFPSSVMEIENPLRHLRSFMEVMSDGVKVVLRMRRKQSHDFTKNAENHGKNLPEYYTRNFHFQTDGYLSEASARRYDHQVEILFAGTGGAMRRMILPILKEHTKGHGHWLELGCGSGSATRSVLEAFPHAKVTAMDMSAPYLKVAQENLRRYSKVDFLQGDGTNLDFKSGTFNAVFSVFVLHELPRAERGALIREAFRVLKPGGVLILADSLQTDDQPDLNWALERFPKTYHEPFYKNYTEDDLQKLVKQATGCVAEMDHAFFTKVVWVQKPLSSSLT